MTALMVLMAFLAGLVVGLWVGWQVTRERMWEQQWREANESWDALPQDTKDAIERGEWEV